MVSVDCPHCRKQLSIEAENAGQQYKCPHCAEILLIPSPFHKTPVAETIAEETLPPKPNSANQETVPPPPKRDENTVTVDPAAAAPTLKAPKLETTTDVPGYEILGELGRGGMGVVYKARHLQLNRLVALKMILAGGHASSDDLVRFLTEAEAVAAFSHPNIVQVHDVGQHQELPFMALEFVEGGSLADKLKDGPLPARQAAQFAEQIAHGLNAAHLAGIVHRDLKPANVLLTKDGAPKIADFGLAKRVEGGAGLTQTGNIMGTPSYMAPEQASGEGKRVGPAADVYALGAILYECLTGRPPFKAATPLDTLLQVNNQEPAPPSQIAAKVPKDLETICLKCLQKQPLKRYGSAAELAEDLRRFQNDEPILARPAGFTERSIKWIKRRPALAVLSACALILALAAGLFAYQSWWAEQVRSDAEDEGRRKLRIGKMQQAQERIWNGDFDAADDSIGEAIKLGAPPEWADWRRGQIAYHRGEVERAVKLLQSAVPKQRGNVAARALLGAAYALAGLWEKYLPISEELITREASSSEDLLYKGLAISFINPAEGLRSLDQGVGQKRSLIALVLRAQANAYHAMKTSDVGVAEAAMADAAAAKSILSGSPTALRASLRVHRIAAGLYGPEQQNQRDAAFAKARKDAEALARFPHLPLAVLGRGRFLEADNREDEARKVWEKALQQPNVGHLVAFMYAQSLYRHGDVSKALDFVDTRVGSPSLRSYLRAYLLAEFPKRHDEAISSFDNYKNTLPEWLRALEYSTFLLFVGRKTEAADTMRQARGALDQAPKHIQPLYKALGAFLSEPGIEAESKLLKVVGKSLPDLVEAQLVIGLHHLADGNRTKARQHFEAGVATRTFYLWSYDWCRSFLGRMKQDPDWPRWINSAK